MFITEDFMLTTATARELYHTSAAYLPIIDYHCHLDPRMIAENHSFKSLTEIWLGGDHYKWRAMRGNGVPEEYITGNRSDDEKFEKWAETVPYTMCNPLYHWSHLELLRAFGIDKLLTPATAREIYAECNEKLAGEEYRARGLMKKFGVEVVCTTDDPADSLEYHRQIRESGFEIKVLPAWRPDRVMMVEDPESYRSYIEKLEARADRNITSYPELLSVLQARHDYFAEMGCKLSDHGIDTFYADPYTSADLSSIFDKVMSGRMPAPEEVLKFKSGVMHDLAVMDAEKGWTQQFHVGAIRNNNTGMFRTLGADIGFDAIHDHSYAAAGHRFLDHLASAGKLAQTILYNLNPKDNEMLAAMACTFNDGSVRGKMQFGAPWWFLDHEEGMRNQLKTLSSQGLLSRFVGMLTDSRSFLSYTRHEYFRRILCDFIGMQVEQGKLPREEMSFIRQMVADISYFNAKDYFRF